MGDKRLNSRLKDKSSRVLPTNMEKSDPGRGQRTFRIITIIVILISQSSVTTAHRGEFSHKTHPKIQGLDSQSFIRKVSYLRVLPCVHCLSYWADSIEAPLA